jgi:hypothetical protein
MKSWVLQNIEQIAKKNSETFFIPSLNERESQGIDDEVRLHFELIESMINGCSAERMWVKIVKKESKSPKFTGILLNHPLFISDLSIGDEIIFDVEHIAQIIIKEGSPLWIDCAEESALVSQQCLEKNGIVRFLYRQKTAIQEDSGWRMFDGSEDDDYVNNPKNIRVVNVGYLLDKDPTLLTPLKGAIGAAYERNDINDPWKIVTDWIPEE